MSDTRRIARAAARQAAHELGIQPPEVELVSGRPWAGEAHPERYTITITREQNLADIVLTARHETAHLAQAVAGRRVGHGRFDQYDGPHCWRRSTVERFAQGDPKARRKLRDGVLDHVHVRISFEEQET